MGKDLTAKFSYTKKFLDEASDALGFDLSKLCFEGPEEELKKTEITQPAILTVSAMCLEALRSFGKINVEAAQLGMLRIEVLYHPKQGPLRKRGDVG